MGWKRAEFIIQAGFTLLLLFGALATIYPFLYLVSTSLKGPTYNIFEIPPKLIPSNPTLQNFVEAWASNNFGAYFRNSVLVTIIATTLTLLLGSMMAYAFARFNFFLKKPLYYLVIFFMMLPAMSLIVPQFILASRLKLVGNLGGVILVYIAQNIPFATFLLRGFIEQVPREILEASEIDGASHWNIFWLIVLPICKPALATAAIIASLGAWDEYVWANLILTKPGVRTLPVAIANFQGVHVTNWGLVFAASLIAVGPIILFFIFMQKFVIRGIATGAVKG
jgi:ABC-type glycerol-3-phosphate transport system permease component